MLMDMEAAQDAETIARLKKEKHDLKYELYQLRQRVDILEQENNAINNRIKAISIAMDMQFGAIKMLTELTKGFGEDVVKLSYICKEKEEKE